MPERLTDILDIAANATAESNARAVQALLSNIEQPTGATHCIADDCGDELTPARAAISDYCTCCKARLFG